MKTTEQKDQTIQKIPKPKILIILFILQCIQFALAIAILIILAVMGYIGFNLSTSLSLITLNTTQACSSSYVLLKYTNNINSILSINFVMSSLSVLLCIILLIITLKALISDYRPKELTQNEDINISLARRIREVAYSIFIGIIALKIQYIVQSLVILCSIIIFGTYLSFFIQLPTCQFIYLNDQIIIIVGVSAALLFISLIIWIIIVWIIFKVNKQIHQIQKLKVYIGHQDHQHTKQNNIQTNYTQKNQQKQEPKKYVNVDQHNSNVNNSHANKYSYKNEIIEQEKYQKEKSVETPGRRKSRFKQYEMSHLNRNNEDQSKRDNLLEKDNRYGLIYSNNKGKQTEDHFKLRQSPKYQLQTPKTRKQLYQSPYGGIKESSYFRSNQGYSKKLSRHKFNDDDDRNYAQQNSNRKILAEGTIHEAEKPKLHESYFRDSRNNVANVGGSPKRRGMLSRYIQGKYIQ